MTPEYDHGDQTQNHRHGTKAINTATHRCNIETNNQKIAVFHQTVKLSFNVSKRFSPIPETAFKSEICLKPPFASR
mgnify:CR=1 FL=1